MVTQLTLVGSSKWCSGFCNRNTNDLGALIDQVCLMVSAYSLERRLVPWHCIMKVLQAKEFLNSNMGFHIKAQIGE
jgi:hypothetical protein